MATSHLAGWGHTSGFEWLLQRGLQFLEPFLGSQLVLSLFPNLYLGFQRPHSPLASGWLFHSTLITLSHPCPHYLKSKCWAAALYDSKLPSRSQGTVEKLALEGMFISPPFITLKGSFQILSSQSKIKIREQCLLFVFSSNGAAL